MYRKVGYHLEKQIVPKEEIVLLRNQMIKVFRVYTKDEETEFNKLIIDLFRQDTDGFVGCANICQNMIEVCKLSLDQRIIDLVQQLGLKWPSINTRPLVSFSSPLTSKNENYWKVPAHQDWPSTQGSINGLTCWMPLVDVDTDLGPLEISPRTHLQGYLEHDDKGVPYLTDKEHEFVAVKMECGDALFFSNFTIHRSGINKSDRIRWSMHFRYNDILEPTFVNRKFPRHRIDRRKEGILIPGFPSSDVIHDTFLNDTK